MWASGERGHVGRCHLRSGSAPARRSRARERVVREHQIDLAPHVDAVAAVVRQVCRRWRSAPGWRPTAGARSRRTAARRRRRSRRRTAARGRAAGRRPTCAPDRVRIASDEQAEPASRPSAPAGIRGSSNTPAPATAIGIRSSRPIRENCRSADHDEDAADDRRREHERTELVVPVEGADSSRWSGRRRPARQRRTSRTGRAPANTTIAASAYAPADRRGVGATVTKTARREPVGRRAVRAEPARRGHHADEPAQRRRRRRRRRAREVAHGSPRAHRGERDQHEEGRLGERPGAAATDAWASGIVR